jgi:putative flippase GtrA
MSVGAPELRSAATSRPRLKVPARFLRFATVGVVNTAITFVVYSLCTGLLHVPAAGANVIGWVAGFVNSFLLNRAWTFRDRQDGAGRTVLRFGLSTLVALGVSEAVVVAGEALASGWSASGHASQAALMAIEAIAIGVSLAVNYLLASRWAFKAH